MKIAQIVPSLKPTGPVNVALDLAKTFRQLGHQVHFFYFDELPGAVQEEASKITLSQPVNWDGYDVVHSHGLRPDQYIRRHYRSMPITVSTLHNYVRQELTFSYGKMVAAFFTPVWSWFCAKHDANVALSHHMKLYYFKFWRNQNLVHIPNTRIIDLKPNQERVAEVGKIAAGRKILGSVSHLTKRKGTKQIFPFLEQNKDWVYVHIGGGNTQELIKKAAYFGVEDRCFFMGAKERGWEYAAAFDVFILPSYSEGFPLSLMEAVQIGVPVVCSGLPVFNEIFSPKEICLFELENTKSLQQAVFKALTDKDELVRNAKSRFESEYHPTIVAKQYLELYNYLG